MGCNWILTITAQFFKGCSARDLQVFRQLFTVRNILDQVTDKCTPGRNPTAIQLFVLVQRELQRPELCLQAGPRVDKNALYNKTSNCSQMFVFFLLPVFYIWLTTRGESSIMHTVIPPQKFASLVSVPQSKTVWEPLTLRKKHFDKLDLRIVTLFYHVLLRFQFRVMYFQRVILTTGNCLLCFISTSITVSRIQVEILTRNVYRWIFVFYVLFCFVKLIYAFSNNYNILVRRSFHFKTLESTKIRDTNVAYFTASHSTHQSTFTRSDVKPNVRNLHGYYPVNTASEQHEQLLIDSLLLRTMIAVLLYVIC